MRFSVRRIRPMISRTNQCDAWSCRTSSTATTASGSPTARTITVPISGSLSRSRSRASSNSRNARSAHELSPAFSVLVARLRLRRIGSRDGDVAGALRSIDRALHVRVLNGVAVDRRRQRPELHTRSRCGPIGLGRQRLRMLRDRLLELAGRIDGIDEPAFDGALAAHAFGQRAEIVGEVAAHLALVDDAREAAGAGQHAEERRLRQANRRAAIVDEHDLVARERELVAAAGADAVHRGEELDAAVGAHVFHAEPRFVGELAEVHLERVARAAEHEDVGAGAEDARLEAGQHDGVHFGMLEAQPLQHVGQLDVDAEIVGIQFELVVVRPQAGVFAHVHRERRDVAVDAQFPVLVLRGIGFEIDGRRSDCLFHGAKFTTDLNARSNP